MARVTVEDCVDKVPEPVRPGSVGGPARAPDLGRRRPHHRPRPRQESGRRACARSPRRRSSRSELEEAIVTNLQKVRVDEEDETEELASLSDAAEALRLTAAAPPRPTPSGGDYE